MPIKIYIYHWKKIIKTFFIIKFFQYFYNFTYECSIAISSECISSKDEYCVPKKLVDLNFQDKSSLRNLKQIDNTMQRVRSKIRKIIEDRKV